LIRRRHPFPASFSSRALRGIWAPRSRAPRSRSAYRPGDRVDAPDNETQAAHHESVQPSYTWPSCPRRRHRGGRSAMKEQNVIGTMQLLAACQQARAEPHRGPLVHRAYGASFRDPAVFTESTEPREVPRAASRATCSTSRATCAVSAGAGPTCSRPCCASPVHRREGRHHAHPLLLPGRRATVFGRDPRLQFVHVDDALEILHRR